MKFCGEVECDSRKYSLVFGGDPDSFVDSVSFTRKILSNLFETT